MSERLWRLRRALEAVTELPPLDQATVEVRLKSPLNGSGGASVAARHATAARRRTERAVGQRLAGAVSGRTSWGLTTLGVGPGDRIVVLLTRVSPRPYDDDNLAAALKSVRDGMASWWGLDDGNDAVVWLYDSERGAPRSHAVRASLWTLRGDASRDDCEVDASDYERPQRRELRATPNVIRARGGA